jgi:hypothetical protein
MSYAEAPQETVLKFLKSNAWKNASPETIAAGLKCSHNESHLKLNPWQYELRENRLFDPVQNSFVTETKGFDEQEDGVMSQLETWFLENESGIAIHISPRKESNNIHPGYPEEQLTIYRISYELNIKTMQTKKVLFLTSHQFDHHFKNPDEIRRFIFTEKDNEEAIFEILDYLEKISSKKVEREIKEDPRATELAIKYAYMKLSGVPEYTIVDQMDRDNFLGNNPIGCPPVYTSSITTQIYNYALNKEGWEWKPGVCRPAPDGCGQYKSRVGPCQICEDCQNEKYGG